LQATIVFEEVIKHM